MKVQKHASVMIQKNAEYERGTMIQPKGSATATYVLCNSFLTCFGLIAVPYQIDLEQVWGNKLVVLGSNATS
jgi:hypothetical protein